MPRQYQNGRGYWGDFVLPRKVGARLDPERRADAEKALRWVSQQLEDAKQDLGAHSARRIDALLREQGRLSAALGVDVPARI